MVRLRGTLLTLALAAPMTVGCGEGSAPSPGFPDAGDPAPRFSLRSATGETVNLAELAGRDVLLYFSMGPG